MMRKHKWCNLIGFLLGLLVVAPVLIMLFDRRQPLDLLDGHIRPVDVRGGEEARVTWTAHERRACDGELHRFFIDSAGIVHPSVVEPTVYHQTFADQRTFQKLMTIPKGMAPGPAIYTTRIERWCNPLQRALWPIKSDGLRINFNVIE